MEIESRVVKLPWSGCWIWMGTVDKDGYGKLGGSSDARNLRVHRVMYTDRKGPIPDGWHVDHICCVESCCNPDHLQAVTPKRNAQLIVQRGRHPQASKTHCKRGHQDWRVDAKGHRECRECARIAEHRLGSGKWSNLFCRRGHKLYGDGDFYVDSRGKRVCRVCRREREATPSQSAAAQVK